MYPRAAAYIISVKQSTYCQFGEVIRARSRAEGGGAGEAEEEKITGRRGDVRQREEKRKIGFHFQNVKKKRKTFSLSVSLLHADPDVSGPLPATMEHNFDRE